MTTQADSAHDGAVGKSLELVPMQHQPTPRAFAYGDNQTHTVENIAPAEMAAGDVFFHLGQWRTITMALKRPDGAISLYFQGVDNTALPPCLIPEGTLAVTVYRPRAEGPQSLCPICKNPIANCACD